MRITIDLDGAMLEQSGSARQERSGQQEDGRAVEDTDGGAPAPELIESLAMEGALAPIMASFQPLGDVKASPAGPAGSGPVRSTWESGSLMRKRRD